MHVIDSFRLKPSTDGSRKGCGENREYGCPRDLHFFYHFLLFLSAYFTIPFLYITRAARTETTTIGAMT